MVLDRNEFELNFEDFEEIKYEEKIVEKGRVIEPRYIIGCDPAEQNGVVNNFIVWDKMNGKVVSRMQTKKPFDYFVDLMLSNKEYAKLYKVSHKFVTSDGRAKTIDDIRGTSF